MNYSWRIATCTAGVVSVNEVHQHHAGDDGIRLYRWALRHIDHPLYMYSAWAIFIFFLHCRAHLYFNNSSIQHEMKWCHIKLIYIELFNNNTT